MKISIPELALVLLIGPSGSGKSTFARTHFRPTEVLSSDAFRAMLADDENDQSVTRDAFEVLDLVVGKRLASGRLTVVDATNVQLDARRPLIKMARDHDVQSVAIVFDLPERVCQERNRARTDRRLPPNAIYQQWLNLRGWLPSIQREGFYRVYVLKSAEDVESARVERKRLPVDCRDDHGPFDIIGDVHGCFDELRELLGRLGYTLDGESVHPPQGRKAVFLGDLVDRGPSIPQVLRLVMGMVRLGTALCVPGNHDMKLLRKLKGHNVQILHGLGESVEQLASEPAPFRQEVIDFLDGLPSHYVLDQGQLVAAHAGLKESLQGRMSGRVREFALYGETTGELDQHGLPVRLDWAAHYRGKARVIYGHTPVQEPTWVRGTINIDTGCVFGGKLSALRYPELALVSVPAARTYATPSRPFLLAGQPTLALNADKDDVLDEMDVQESRTIVTSLVGNVTIREPAALAALQIIDQTAADPRWTIYLPPAVTLAGRSRVPGFVQHPAGVFAYYRRQGVQRVVCRERTRGAPVVLVACRDTTAARRRFGVEGEAGILYTRIGRRLLEAGQQADLIDHVRHVLDRAGMWDSFSTDWVCLECEVGQGNGPAGLRVTPIQIMAAEGRPPGRQGRVWQLETLAGLCRVGAAIYPGRTLLAAPVYRVVNLADPADQSSAVAWWQDLDARGGRGVVIQPTDFVVRGPRGIAQPAIECQGPRYRSTFYGADEPGVVVQRATALREFALGVEALERFIRREPLRRVQECIMGILALEAEE